MERAEQKVMVFKGGIPGTIDQVFRSPEELAKSDIQVHPAAVEQTWGKGAGNIYMQARGFKPWSPAELDGTITEQTAQPGVAETPATTLSRGVINNFTKRPIGEGDRLLVKALAAKTAGRLA